MSEWKKYRLEDIVSKLGDGLHGTPIYDDNGDYYFINGNNLINGKIVIKENTRRVSLVEFLKYKKELNDRTILIGINGTIGNVALYNNEKCILGKSACYFNVISSVNKYFIKYVIMSQNFQSYIENFANGTTIKNVSLKSIREFKFSMPSIKEQNAIASTLCSLDDKIDLLHRQNKTLEQLAETLFRQWFVEEAEGLKPSILEDWILFDPKEKINKSITYQMFDMKCLSNTDLSLGEGIQRNVISSTKFKNEDTLLAKITPCLENGKTGFVMHLDENEVAKGSTEFIVMRTKGIVSPYWIYCLARSKDFRDSAIQSMTGTSGRQRVQIDLIKNFEVKVDIRRMEEFHNSVKPDFKKIKSNTAQIRTLTQLRDTLLPLLIKGEIKISN